MVLDIFHIYSLKITHMPQAQKETCQVLSETLYWMDSVPKSPSMAPVISQKDEILVSGDPNFALHGEAMMISLITVFAFFLLSIVFFLYVKKPSNGIKLYLSSVFSSQLPHQSRSSDSEVGDRPWFQHWSSCQLVIL